MKFIKSSIHFNRVIITLLFSRTFLQLTLIGNLLILGFSYGFYYLEKGINENVTSYLDAAWWGFATATTVGYGDIIPVTVSGKILGITLMLVGTAIFATYTALFAQSIIEDELFRPLFSSKRNNPSLDELLIQRKALDYQIELLKEKGSL